MGNDCRTRFLVFSVRPMRKPIQGDFPVWIVCCPFNINPASQFHRPSPFLCASSGVGCRMNCRDIVKIIVVNEIPLPFDLDIERCRITPANSVHTIRASPKLHHVFCRDLVAIPVLPSIAREMYRSENCERIAFDVAKIIDHRFPLGLCAVPCPV